MYHILLLPKLSKLLIMSFQPNNVDEFGRDLSLRERNQTEIARKNYEAACDFMAEWRRKYAGMSWADITFAIEEEEEEEERKRLEEQKKKEKEKYLCLDNERRQLYTIGEYELEEGELFE